MSKPVKLTVNITEESYEMIAARAYQLGVTKTEVLKRMLAFEAFLFAHPGWKVLVQDSRSGETREVVRFDDY